MIPKFRGKSIADENKGEWMCGNLITDKTSAYITDGDIDAYEDFISIERWCSIDVNTVGQSTGIKDKHYVEIFEGDVVEQKMLIPTSGIEEITGVVKMLEGAWTIVNDKEEIACHLWREGAGMEILGNIYENPELLEADNDTK